MEELPLGRYPFNSHTLLQNSAVQLRAVKSSVVQYSAMYCLQCSKVEDKTYNSTRVQCITPLQCSVAAMHCHFHTRGGSVANKGCSSAPPDSQTGPQQ